MRRSHCQDQGKSRWNFQVHPDNYRTSSGGTGIYENYRSQYVLLFSIHFTLQGLILISQLALRLIIRLEVALSRIFLRLWLQLI